MTDGELKDVRESMDLLNLQARQAQAMRTMLGELAPDGFQGEVAQVLTKMQEQLNQSDAARK